MSQRFFQAPMRRDLRQSRVQSLDREMGAQIMKLI